ncbi:MAG TPA: hypothetical protein DG761_03410 [Gammaproteobacteria bacterium]|nr:hypothetical protein [Acidiferrobacteraceae bacterium]HCX87049.1 hypothetical protein [Gammaproteobacteria bacterium]
MPAGFSKVTGRIEVKSSASDSEISRLQQSASRYCPVLDDLRQPVEVELELVRVGK